MRDPTTTVEPGSDLNRVLTELPDNSLVRLPAGRYPGGIKLRKSVTLVGEGGTEAVIIDADDETRALIADTKGVHAVIEGVTLRGGRANAGGALAVKAFASVTLRDCVLTENESYQVGAGAVFANRGSVTLERCRLLDNQGRDGTVIRVGQVATLVLRDSLVLGADDAKHAVVTLLETADVIVERSTLVAPAGPCLSLAGTTTRTPILRVRDSILAGSPVVTNDPTLPGSVHITRSVLSARPTGPCEDAGDNRLGDPAFTGGHQEPFRPRPDSPAIGLARGGGRDLTGQPRPAENATAGALEHSALEP